ncbi:pantetheine-phosphate adenylyltransferase [Corynebacterium sp. 153RC1]|uniref:pantetheine-phosphate adenylyltransferase n=1 Tax=unclassified Corynebacterium TaxID=2624378 RepID=UPI00211CE49D|nr:MULTISPECIES: pantetheine-phosphate adenylyltransferase [unclassified Corynebacterium]MCQ9370575.1 pantetheine-phosphate adenylyltransferase [Corynebacterium sp. 35RC1]MCQ9352909.1 pantetheine-phosphate adenylyltransferase [Corynebacterium sp. 209RC1]MCQ9353871.1 pantetheine-phosphate adenylyltransferase [Corynebacterium sp. 1222RC1]MCQ9356902.1 pantetheine-phosphate adenylyltransferase [Corynebacterium sp. 122RC1]MCQ9358247.1 pantetheine-phosphate adenylyltransferase [Corynebacterium sp. 1
MKRAICPGSFDPVTMGHLNIFERAAAQYDEVTVLVTANPNKNTGMFTLDERVQMITEATAHLSNVKVDNWHGLLVDYTTAHSIDAIVKGLRSSLDYEYELPMAQMNNRLSGIDTIFLLTDPRFGYLSSTLWKEVVKYGGDVTGMVPDSVNRMLAKKQAE